jgi:LacI family transcriptional regulator
MATLRDVASRAGVSIGSVSAVVNRSAQVSPAMQAKVNAAIEELGYAPDAIARGLKMGRTRTVGLILPDITNPHFAGIARAVETACDAAGYLLMLCSTADDPDKELRHLRLLRMQRVAGLILVLGGIEPGYVDSIRKAISVPAVLVDRVMRGLSFDAVLLDNRKASRVVVDYLIRSGHRRIGFVAGDPRISLSAERLIGYRQALQEHGIAFDPELVEIGDFRVEPAFRATVSLLHRPQRPTAILSTSNHTTIGVMNALAAEGLNCPEDISVAGIDDFEWSSAFAPRLTTAAQPIGEIGTKAVELLLNRLGGDDVRRPRRIVLPPRLVLRDSCRRIEK